MFENIASRFFPMQPLPSEDDIEVDLRLPGDPEEDEEEDEFSANIAEDMEDSELHTLAGEILEYVEADIQARAEWLETLIDGLEVLGMRYEERTEPWDGACGVFSTVLAEAAIRFQAETMSETFPSAGPVKTKILGKTTREKEEAAQRVEDDMNYQLTERMVEYRTEHERMLFSLGISGSAFKKVYHDPAIGRQVSIFVAADDVIVPYGASHIETADRVTHVMRKTKNEMDKLQATGFYRDVDLGEPRSMPTDIEKKRTMSSGYTVHDDERYTLYEVHANLIIPGIDDGDDEDALARPYVVTIDKATQKVLAIRRNWDAEDELFLKRNYFVHYVYVPGLGFYGLGLIHIIGGYARAGTSIIRQLVDAGTLSNLPGGLKSRGLRVKGDDTPIGPGEFRDVDVPSGAIKDNIMTLPYKEPSQVLLSLLNQITEEGRRLGAISDMNVSDMNSQAPVGTTLALLEQTLKPMAAVQSRVHFAMKQEFKLLKSIIAEYAPDDYQYEPETGLVQARQADYAMVDVIPVSDPNSSTMAQRVVQYQAVFQMAQGSPQIYDLPYLHRQMIDVLGVKNAEKIVPTTEDAKPRDPMSENMAALVGKPLKAFIYQDHDAHIAVHQAFMQDPLIAASIGQNPMTQQITASLQAHLAEHTSYAYFRQMEERMGVSLPDPNTDLPEEVEKNLSRLLADAGKQLNQAHQQQAQQQQAQQQQQDPLFQLEQMKAQTAQAEVQRKSQRDQADSQIAMARLDFDREKAGLAHQIEQSRLQLQGNQQQNQHHLAGMKTLLDTKLKAQQQDSQNTQHGATLDHQRLVHLGNMQQKAAQAAEKQPQKSEKTTKKD